MVGLIVIGLAGGGYALFHHQASGVAHTEPYNIGYAYGSQWTRDQLQPSQTTIDSICTDHIIQLPLTYPPTDTSTKADQYHQGCVDGLNANPNRP